MYSMSGVNFLGTPLVGYSFAYDNANRLTASNFGYYTTNWLNTNAYDENNITYDNAGNILHLERYTFTSLNQPAIMDVFNYNYYPGTNKLKYITDLISSSISTTDIDNQITTNYLYDANGNMYQDYANNVRFVINDINNLPLVVYKADGSKLEYTYDVNGQRVLNTSSNKYYVNGLTGSNEAIVDRTDNSKITHNLYGLDLIGQVDRVNITLTRYYYLKDHLGSIKMRVTSNGTVTGYDDYYPFGSIMNRRSSTTGPDVRYKFTGKERDLATSYDYFGARFYESHLGRWLQVDPLADKYPGWSPYNYCFNNPLIIIDPDGMDTTYHTAQIEYNHENGSETITEEFQDEQNDPSNPLGTITTTTENKGVITPDGNIRVTSIVTEKNTKDKWAHLKAVKIGGSELLTGQSAKVANLSSELMKNTKIGYCQTLAYNYDLANWKTANAQTIFKVTLTAIGRPNLSTPLNTGVSGVTTGYSAYSSYKSGSQNNGLAGYNTNLVLQFRNWYK